MATTWCRSHSPSEQMKKLNAHALQSCSFLQTKTPFLLLSLTLKNLTTSNYFLSSTLTLYSFRCSIYGHVYIYSTPPPRTGCDTRSFFKWSTIQSSPSLRLVVWPRLQNSLCPIQLPKIGEKHGSMPFPRALAWNEALSTSSRIWTRVADSVFNDDNTKTKSSSYIWLCDTSTDGYMMADITSTKKVGRHI